MKEVKLWVFKTRMTILWTANLDIRLIIWTQAVLRHGERGLKFESREFFSSWILLSKLLVCAPDLVMIIQDHIVLPPSPPPSPLLPLATVWAKSSNGYQCSHMARHLMIAINVPFRLLFSGLRNPRPILYFSIITMECQCLLLPIESKVPWYKQPQVQLSY